MGGAFLCVLCLCVACTQVDSVLYLLLYRFYRQQPSIQGLCSVLASCSTSSSGESTRPVLLVACLAFFLPSCSDIGLFPIHYLPRYPSRLCWPSCSCGSGFPFPSSSAASTLATGSKHTSILYGPIRSLDRFQTSCGILIQSWGMRLLQSFRL